LQGGDDNLRDSDLRDAFDAAPLGLSAVNPFNPQLSFTPEMRVRALGDYEEAFRDHFSNKRRRFEE
jgi:hypothetical protein